MFFENSMYGVESLKSAKYLSGHICFIFRKRRKNVLRKKTFYPTVGYLLICLAWLSWSDPCITETRCVEWNTAGACIHSEASSGNYGCPFTDKFKNVTAYGNGGWTGSGIGNPDFQCVGLAKRFYSQFFGINFGSVGSAINIFTEFDNPSSQSNLNLKRFGLELFPNGGNVAPRMGDMIVFGGESYGHVAVFCGINGNGKAQIFEQNVNYPTNPFRDLDYLANGNYTFTGNPVLGWVHLAVGSYVNGFHLDAAGNALDWTSKVFIDTFKVLSPKIGLPHENGGTQYVHQWLGQTNSSFGVVVQDFLQGNLNLAHYGADGKSMLVLDDLDGDKKCNLLSGGFLGHYCENDGPYAYGVPCTTEIQCFYANSHLVSADDFIQPIINRSEPKRITVQKFKRRLANGSYYNEERRTLVYDPNGNGIVARYNVKNFPVGEFSISDNCNGVQWYVIKDAVPAHDVAWPMLGVTTPTGTWFTKSGQYNFVRHDANGGRLSGQGFSFTADIHEGNYQFFGDPSPEVSEPKDLVVASVSQNSIAINWNQGANAISGISYHVYRSTSQYVGSASEIASTTSNSYGDVGLSSNTKYYYWVKAAIGSELSDFSDSVCVTTQSQPADGSVPTAPSDLVCAFESNIQVMVSWGCGSNNPNNIASYKLFMGTTNNSSQASCCGTTPFTGMFSPALNSASTYWFWVKAVNHNGVESGFSSVATVNMANSISPPENLAGTNSNGSANLSWSCQTSSVVFKIYRATQSDFSNQQMVSQQYPLIFTDANCQSGTTYYYRVCSTLNGAISNYSNYVSVATSVFPAPDNFRIVEVKPGRVKLAWSRPSGNIYYYWIFRQLNGSQQWAHAAYDTFYVDTTPVCGKTYSYRIRGQSDQMSDISSPVLADIPFKKKVYTDFVFLPDADSNGYNEVAGLYKKGDSALVSILDLGNNLVLQTFYLGNYQPNSLVQINVNGQVKLLAGVNDSIADTTKISILDLGLNSQTFVLSQPINFQSTSSSYDQIRLSWSRGSNDSSGLLYYIYASQTNDSVSVQFIGSTSGTSYVQAGLSPGGSWYYWLRAAVGLEISPLVGPISAATNALSAPANLAARQVAYDRVILGWDTVAGVNGYRIYRNDDYLTYVSADSLIDLQVDQHSQYVYRIVSVYGNFYSSLGDALTVVTPWQQAISSIAGFEDMEFLPDLDNDGQPELALLGIDNLTSRPVVYIKSGDGTRVVTAIPFFSPGTLPKSFMPIIDLNSDGLPEFTILGSKGDTVKIETRYFSGDTLIHQ
jgi:hypothetical protein